MKKLEKKINNNVNAPMGIKESQGGIQG